MGRRGTSGRLNLRMVGVVVYDITITSPAREPGQEPVGRSLSGNPLGKPSRETLWGNPLGKPSGETLGETLGGSSRIPRDRHHTTPPSDLRPKNGGSPPSSPHGEREEKGEEKGGLHTLFPQFFSGGEPPHPPQLARRGRPAVGGKDKRGGARVWRAGRTKSIDLIETSSMELVSHSYLASLRSYNAPKFTPFPGVIRLYWWGKQG